MLAYPKPEVCPDTSMISDVEPNVLIVDDDDIAAEELAEVLDLEGFKCITANTTEKALSITCEFSSISVIITDFYLRKDVSAAGNGLTLIDDIREVFPQRAFDFIVVSGDPDILAECALSGTDKFLAKPVAPESICSMVKDATALEAPTLQKEEVGDGVSSLHRMIQIQADTIASLTEALSANRSNDNNVKARMDRLVSAAVIAKRRSEDSGVTDTGELLNYIVGQGGAVKKLLDTAVGKPRDIEVVNISALKQPEEQS